MIGYPMVIERSHGTSPFSVGKSSEMAMLNTLPSNQSIQITCVCKLPLLRQPPTQRMPWQMLQLGNVWLGDQ